MKTVVYIFHFEVQILGNFSQEACGVSKNALKEQSSQLWINTVHDVACLMM